MTKEMKRPTSHISGNSIKPALSKAVEFYTDNNRQAYDCIHERDEYIDYLESQLNSAKPQQALPVVPWCVGKTVEILKKKPESSWSKLYEALGEEGVTWLNEFQHKDERFGFGGLNSKLFVLFHLAINGYTVEKSQLFYLKNKLTCQYLYRRDKVSYGEQDYCKDSDEKPLGYCSFTQQEIDRMETGSYEQIEVEK